MNGFDPPPHQPLISQESLLQGLLKLKKVSKTNKESKHLSNDSSRYVIRKCESMTFQDNLDQGNNLKLITQS